MNKITLALVLGTGLTLSLAAPTARPRRRHPDDRHPDALGRHVQRRLRAVQHRRAVPVPVRRGRPSHSGLIESQVFQGIDGTPTRALRLRLPGRRSTRPTAAATPIHVDSASFQFNATPLGSDLPARARRPTATWSPNGQVGGLNLSGTQAPTTLSWQPDADDRRRSGRSTSTRPRRPGRSAAGTNSATFVLLSTQLPCRRLEADRSTSAAAPRRPPSRSPTRPPPARSSRSPSPEPATLLAWAGMAGAVALVLRFRKARLAAA